MPKPIPTFEEWLEKSNKELFDQLNREYELRKALLGLEEAFVNFGDTVRPIVDTVAKNFENIADSLKKAFKEVDKK